VLFWSLQKLPRLAGVIGPFYRTRAPSQSFRVKTKEGAGTW
jgi:hypothetical protein